MKNKTLAPADVEYVFSLFERHKGVMYKTALDLDVRGDLINDVVHDALLQLVHYAQTLRGMSERSRVAYMASSVRSVVFNLSARGQVERRRRGEMTWEPASASVEDDFLEREAHRDRLAFMWEALDELSEADRRLLIEKYIGGKSDGELSAQMKTTPAAVRKKLTRARRRARRIIQRKEERER